MAAADERGRLKAARGAFYLTLGSPACVLDVFVLNIGTR